MPLMPILFYGCYGFHTRCFERHDAAAYLFRDAAAGFADFFRHYHAITRFAATAVAAYAIDYAGLRRHYFFSDIY